jgi:hypothetical protein
MHSESYFRDGKLTENFSACDAHCIPDRTVGEIATEARRLQRLTNWNKRDITAGYENSVTASTSRGSSYTEHPWDKSRFQHGLIC